MSIEQLLVGGIIGLVSGAGLVAFAWVEREKDLERERRAGDGTPPRERRRRDRHPPSTVPPLRIVRRAREELVAQKGIDQVRFEDVMARAREIAAASGEGVRV